MNQLVGLCQVVVGELHGFVCCLLSLAIGRDPLYNVTKKVDVTAVASVLKMYFRELTTPLFPTDKYHRFIQCTSKSVGREGGVEIQGV